MPIPAAEIPGVVYILAANVTWDAWHHQPAAKSTFARILKRVAASTTPVVSEVGLAMVCDLLHVMGKYAHMADATWVKEVT